MGVRLCRFKLCFLVAVCIGMLSLVSLCAQEYRASINGTVTDPSGAAIPGAQIKVTSEERNVSFSTISNPEGAYLVPFLQPGYYRVEAELPGFRRYVRSGIELRVNDHLRLDIQMALGEMTETVTVTDRMAVIDTSTASRGTVITNTELLNVPTSGRNPFQLAWLSPGVLKQGTWRYLRPLDFAGSSGMSINGGRPKENEVLIDGVTAVRSERSISLVPTVDATQEFKVQTNTYDAQYGRSGGGVINISLRSGTNAYHGSAFFDEQASVFNANTFELNRGGTIDPETGKARRPSAKIHTFGTQVDGPVRIPGLFDGRDKLFFMVNYEGIRQGTADPGVVTFPTADVRNGDFSSLRNSSGQPVLIYDPLTTRLDPATNTYVRDQFPNNVIPANRIDPVALKIVQAQYYPLPNGPGDGPHHANNYTYPSRWVQHFDSYIGRLDWAVNSRNNVYVRYGHNLLHEHRSTIWGTNAAEPSGNQPLVRGDTSGAVDWTSTLNPTTLFNARIGALKWHNRSGTFGAGFDPTTIGFPSSLVAQYNKPWHFPQFNLEGYQAFGASRPETLNPDYTYSVQTNLTKTVRTHTIKTGFEFRVYRWFDVAPGNTTGSFSFTRIMTGRNPAKSDTTSGDSYASFLLGYPGSGNVQKNQTFAWQNLYYVLYLQDDWRVTSRLTLNLGLRWDYEAPTTERFNRQTRGFAFGQPAPISAPPLNLTGGLLYAGTEGESRLAFAPDRNNLQPRVGMAYKVTEKMVLRGGYGLYYLGQRATGGTNGYAQSTPIVASTEFGKPGALLYNPFPARLLEPIGNALGTSTDLGLGISFNYLNRSIPYAHTFSIDFERELSWNLVLDVAYVGNRTRRLPVSAALNVYPVSELGKPDSYYAEKVANPMAGLLPNNASLNGSTIQRRYLLVPFPQYSGVTMNNIPIGSSSYNGMQSKLVKRFTRGFSILAGYTWSKTLEQISFLNNQDFNLSDPDSSRLERRLARELDTPHRFTLASTWNLPFGKGERWLPDAPGWANQIVGGWQVNGFTEVFSGYAVDHPNGPKTTEASAALPESERTIMRWFNNTIWKAQTPNTLRDFPTVFPDIRFPTRFDVNLSIFKNFPITEQAKLQYRCEMINAFNHPWFTGLATTSATSSSLGQLNLTQRNLPRTIHMQLKIIF
ncbi:MAG: TonB-dependent receptor [Acidobacteria bacterium]|nr:TonB-dependent receptor [Acidobacteriota bacterium]